MLEIAGLRVAYLDRNRRAVAVRDIDVNVAAGSAVALVGESGSGKSTVVLSVMRLITPPGGKIEAGTIRLDGEDLLRVKDDRMRQVLHNDIGYVPQDPTAALDPLCTIGRHIDETLADSVPRAKRTSAIAQLLESLGMPNASKRLSSYPHEFSGGMKQRVAIATALARNPKLMIADEPTTALDVTTQLGILRLLDRLCKERHLALLFVTHDLSVARVLCQEVVVLYGGEVMESGPISMVMDTPRHPYTQALVDAVPSMSAPRAKLRAIRGHPPSLVEVRVGCPFAPRCPLADDRCAREKPALESYNGVKVACWKVDRKASS
jgi:oligopeptide/dipeptide ABC transporter ATP-binding protein